MESMTIICKEVSPKTGEITVYKCKDNPPTADYSHLKMRALMNPTLQYFVTLTSSWEKFSGFIKACLEKNCPCNLITELR